MDFEDWFEPIDGLGEPVEVLLRFGGLPQFFPAAILAVDQLDSIVGID